MGHDSEKVGKHCHKDCGYIVTLHTRVQGLYSLSFSLLFFLLLHLKCFVCGFSKLII